jgi:DnaJ homolog subfamily B member 4
VTSDLPFTLEELYLGKQKRMKISRKVNGVDAEETIDIGAKPGWKAGTKITFSGKGGDSIPGRPAADLVFVVKEKPHALFKRDGNDLVMDRTVTLKEALCGYLLQFDHLNGASYKFQISDVIQPDMTKTVANLGMPDPKNPGTFGHLRIQFRVRFPQNLSDEQKDMLRQTLSYA